MSDFRPWTPDDHVARCLPVAPTVEKLEVIRVTYCTFDRADKNLAHAHEAYYDLDGHLLVETCTHGESK